jgi:hypothetical protein
MSSYKWLHSDEGKCFERAHPRVSRDIILYRKEQCRKCLQLIRDRRGTQILIVQEFLNRPDVITISQ